MSEGRGVGVALARIFAWTLRIALFLVVISFAVANQDPVTVRYFLDQAWEAPLVLVLLIAFAAGAALGLLGCVPAILRQRRRIARLSRESAARQRDTNPPPPESALLP